MTTDESKRGHSGVVQGESTWLGAEDAGRAPERAEPPEPLVFADLYEAHFSFIWRSALRLGVQEDAASDVVQDVFLLAYRRLDSFEGRSTPRTWLFGILRRVVSDRRRSQARKPTEPLTREPEDVAAVDGPMHAIERTRARQLVHAVLDTLDTPHREVLVLADLEQMTAPDIARALELNLNTVYSRLRTARQRFQANLERLRHQAAHTKRRRHG